MIDAPAILRTYLLSKTALTTLTGTRIWAERTNPPDGYKPSVGSAIAFRARGGNVDYASAVLRASWQFKCYGVDEAAANTLYRTLFNVLNDAQGGGFFTAQLENIGQTLREPDTNWVYVLCFYETFMLAQPA
jgi:hypothetical protein